MKDTRVLPVRKKRRSRPSLRRRLGTFWLASVVAVGLLVWAAVAIVRWPGFDAHAIAVTGERRVDRAEIVRAAAIDPRVNVWLTDLATAQRRVEAIPYVATAHIRRTPPAAVTVVVTEREPEGCVAFDGHPAANVTVDATRRVLATGCVAAPRPLYLVRGAPSAPGTTVVSPELAQLQADRARLHDLGRDFAQLRFDRFGGLVATLPDGIAVLIGDDDDELGRKEGLIGPVLAAVSNRLSAVAAVDVRAPSAPVVEYRP